MGRSLIGKLLNQGAPPVSYAPRAMGRSLLGAMPGRATSETYLKAVGANGTLWQIVHRLSSDSAGPEWRLYRKTTDGRRRYSTASEGSDQRTEVLQHAALSVLNRPAMIPGTQIPAFTRRGLFELSGMYLELTGESPWVVDYDPRASFPMGLWPVRPDRLEAVPDPDTFLKGWIYTGPDGEKVPLRPEELILEKYPNPWDVYRGLGPVQAILVDLQAAQYSAQWNLGFFLNSAEPGGIIEVDHSLSDTEWDDLVERWREAHQGVSRAHRVAVLEGGQTWKPNAMSLRDMDFTAGRNLGRDIIREAFAMHKSIMGQSDDVNRANAQTALEVYQGTLITERLNRRKETLNEQFLPLFGSTGQGVEFDFVSPVAPNREEDNAELLAKANAAAVLISQAGLVPKDVLETVGLPDMAVAEKATQAPALPPGWLPEPAAPAPAPATKADAALAARWAGSGLSEDDAHARLARMLSNGHMPVRSLR
ncbi:MAG TPA: phage portal protein [Streptosporangiaceae bacterium]|nr:phage portal protein [Streptosporangiaceae bacterium]